MQLNEAVKEAIKILSEIHVGNMTPMAEEAWKSAIKILEDSLQLMKQQQRPVAWIDVKPNPFDPSCRGAASVQDHALPPGEHKLYAAPQPTESLRCKSTQKRLATLWGYVKKEPDHFHDAAQMVPTRQPLTDEQIKSAVRHLYGSDAVAAMAVTGDIKTARAIEEAIWKQNS